MCQGFSYFSAFLHHFVLAKLAAEGLTHSCHCKCRFVHMILLQSTLAFKSIRVVCIVLINISPSNLFPRMHIPEIHQNRQLDCLAILYFNQ